MCLKYVSGSFQPFFTNLKKEVPIGNSHCTGLHPLFPYILHNLKSNHMQAMGSTSLVSIWAARSLGQSFSTLHDSQPFQWMHTHIYSYFLNKISACNCRRGLSPLLTLWSHSPQPTHPLCVGSTEPCPHILELGFASVVSPPQQEAQTMYPKENNTQWWRHSFIGAELLVGSVQTQVIQSWTSLTAQRKKNLRIKVTPFFEVYLKMEIEINHLLNSPRHF